MLHPGLYQPVFASIEWWYVCVASLLLPRWFLGGRRVRTNAPGSLATPFSKLQPATNLDEAWFHGRKRFLQLSAFFSLAYTPRRSRSLDAPHSGCRYLARLHRRLYDPVRLVSRGKPFVDKPPGVLLVGRPRRSCRPRPTRGNG